MHDRSFFVFFFGFWLQGYPFEWDPFTKAQGSRQQSDRHHMAQERRIPASGFAQG